MLDTSTVILLGRIHDPSALPDEAVISAITLADLSVDTGIDLVARERDTGDYTAIQCKLYELTYTFAKGDIESL